MIAKMDSIAEKPVSRSDLKTERIEVKRSFTEPRIDDMLS